MRTVGKTVINFGPIGREEMIVADYMVDSRGQVYLRLPWGQVMKDKK